MATKPEMLTIREVCDWLKVSRTTVYAHVHDGDFPAPVKVGGQNRWRRADVENYLNRETVTA